MSQKFTVDGIPDMVYNACPYLDSFKGIPFIGIHITWNGGEMYTTVSAYIQGFKDGLWHLLEE
jgi:hypothetical protein